MACSPTVAVGAAWHRFPFARFIPLCTQKGAARPPLRGSFRALPWAKVRPEPAPLMVSISFIRWEIQMGKPASSRALGLSLGAVRTCICIFFPSCPLRAPAALLRSRWLPFCCTSQLRQNGGFGGISNHHSLCLLKSKIITFYKNGGNFEDGGKNPAYPILKGGISFFPVSTWVQLC